MFTASLSLSQKTLPTVRTLCRSIFVQRSTAQRASNVALYAMYNCTCPRTKTPIPSSQFEKGLSKTLKSLSRDDCSLMKSTPDGHRIIPYLSRNGSDLEQSTQSAVKFESMASTERTRQIVVKTMGRTNYFFSSGDRPSEFFMNHQIRYISTRSRRKVGLKESRKLSTKGEDNVTHETKSTNTSSETKEEGDDEKQLTLYQRFKKTYKEHGKVLVAVHIATSTVWFGTFYAVARGGVDIVPYLESWNLSDRIISPFRSGGLGDIALAYLMYKLATPARYTVTIGGTRLAISYLRKEGKMQPVPKGDTLRELYKEGKADLKSKSDSRLTKLRKRRVKRPPHGKDQ